MPADFISNLFVFILAGFVGFELIKRVSPLLHTPLMSLTNALDAIVVVAAIIICRPARDRRSPPSSAPSPWLPPSATWSAASSSPTACCACSRAAKPKNHDTWSPSQQLIDFAYIAAAVLFILSLKWLSSPATARRGVLAGEIAAALAVTAHALQSRPRPIQVDRRRADHRRRHRHPARHGPHDGRAAANRPQPRLRRAVRGHDRYRRVLRARSARHEIQHGRDCTGSDHRLAHLYRQPDRRRKTPGNSSAAPHHLQQGRTSSASRSSAPRS